MKQNEELYVLIKSLKKSEKRYFKLHSGLQAGNKNYLRLFDEISAQAEKGSKYDEKIIKQKFKNEIFVKQLTFTKNYLAEMIFKSLAMYYSGSSVDFLISQQITKARILYNKALYKYFFKVTGSIKKTCMEYERFSFYLQVLEMEKVVIIKKIYPDKDETDVLDEEIKILNMIRNITEYNFIISQLASLYRKKGRFREESQAELLEKINERYIMISEDKALSDIARERYYFILQLLADLQGNNKQIYTYAVKRFEIINNNPKPFKDQSFNYWQDIIMYILLHLLKSNDLDLFDKYMKMLREHTGKTEAEQINLFLIESLFTLLQLNNITQISEINTKVISILNELNKNEGKIDSNFEILIYNSIVKVYFKKNMFTEANKYINILLNHPQISVREDVELYAKIINLIIHLELGNIDLLEYLIKSTYRYLRNRNNVYRFETILMKFLRKLPGIVTNSQFIELLELAKRDINQLKNDPFEKNAVVQFDFSTWIDRKIASLQLDGRNSKKPIYV
ncbi:MAG: hypothetical protein K8I03_12255 [Ignavibacteria bacterium]|nr:hypothetical protein [Ignavibacteria bacterium]